MPCSPIWMGWRPEWQGQLEESPGQRPGHGLCQGLWLIPIAGSDAHLAQEIGNGDHHSEAADRPSRHSTALLDGKGWITGGGRPPSALPEPIYQVEKTHAPCLWKVGGVRPEMPGRISEERGGKENNGMSLIVKVGKAGKRVVKKFCLRRSTM